MIVATPARLKTAFANDTASALLSLLSLAVAIKLVVTTTVHGWDFEVYWRTARALFDGLPVYSVEREGAMVYKYPPWNLPFFLPFGLLPLAAAKATWGLLQGLSLLFCLFWLRERGVRAGTLCVCLALFAGIWSVHALVGQITLPLLALGLVFTPAYAGRTLGTRFQLLAWALSSKIFTLFPLLAWGWGSKRLRSPATWKALALTAALWVGLSLPALRGVAEHSPGALVHEWAAAASSGATPVQGLKIGTQSREMQGLQTMLLRLSGSSENDWNAVLLLSVLVAAAVALWWSRAAAGLAAETRWLGWLALTATVQPLGWFHFFAMAFPLAAWTLDQALLARRKALVALTLLSLLMMGALTEKTLGSLGSLLELVSIKSWGVLLCAGIALRVGALHRRLGIDAWPSAPPRGGSS